MACPNCGSTELHCCHGLTLMKSSNVGKSTFNLELLKELFERNRMTNFDNVSQLNEAYGNQKGDPFNPDWEKIYNQAKNILDEYYELMDDGIDAKNIDQVRDAICDILVFTYGLGHIAGVPVDLDMYAVDVSNRSKFCRNQQELVDTLTKYEKMGVKVYSEGDFPFVRVRSSKEQTVDGKSYPANKVLKGTGFKEPEFSPLWALSVS